MHNIPSGDNSASEKEQENEKIYLTRSKHDKENPYVMISKALLRDKNLTPEDKGFLCYLLSLRDDWKVIPKQLARVLGVGRNKIYKMIDNLTNAGYCQRFQDRKNNQYSNYHYEFAESPIFKKTLPYPEKPDTVNSTEELKKCLTLPHFGETENEETENGDAYRIKNILNTEDKDILCASAGADAKKSPSPASQKKPQKKPDKPKAAEMLKRREFIKTSEQQHTMLCEKYGDAKVEKYYDALNDWKTSKSESDPKSLERHSDFYRITRWVAKDTDAQEEEKSKTSAKYGPPKVDVEKQYENKKNWEKYLRHNYAKAVGLNVYIADKVCHARIGADEIYYDNPKFTDLVKHSLRKVGL